MEFKELTRAEEEVMQCLWDLQPAFVKDIVEAFPEPKPAYNTVSTIIRILETKGFVDHKAYGRTHQYFTLITKEAYRTFSTKKLMAAYYDNSAAELVSYFVKDKNISAKDLDEILETLKNLKV